MARPAGFEPATYGFGSCKSSFDFNVTKVARHIFATGFVRGGGGHARGQRAAPDSYGLEHILHYPDEDFLFGVIR